MINNILSHNDDSKFIPITLFYNFKKNISNEYIKN